MFLIGFPNAFIVHSRSSFWLVKEYSLNHTSGLVLLCFFLLRRTFLFRFTLFCRFFDILREIFLTSLGSHSAQSAFKQQLFCKAIQNEESQYKKNQSQKQKRDKPIEPIFRCPVLELCSHKF